MNNPVRQQKTTVHLHYRDLFDKDFACPFPLAGFPEGKSNKVLK